MSFVARVAADRAGRRRVHARADGGGESHLLDFFVAAPGKGLDATRSRPPSTRSRSSAREDAPQVFNIGPSSCGVYGTTPGLAQALDRFGTVSLSELVAKPGRRRAPQGVRRTGMQGYLFKILDPIVAATPECEAIYAPDGGRAPGRATRSGCPSWATCSIASAPRGPASSTRVRSPPHDRLGARARRAAHGARTSPATGSMSAAGRGRATAAARCSRTRRRHGGILIADALDLLERLERARTTCARWSR